MTQYVYIFKENRFSVPMLDQIFRHGSLVEKAGMLEWKVVRCDRSQIFQPGVEWVVSGDIAKLLNSGLDAPITTNIDRVFNYPSSELGSGWKEDHILDDDLSENVWEFLKFSPQGLEANYYVLSPPFFSREVVCSDRVVSILKVPVIESDGSEDLYVKKVTWSPKWISQFSVCWVSNGYFIERGLCEKITSYLDPDIWRVVTVEDLLASVRSIEDKNPPLK